MKLEKNALLLGRVFGIPIRLHISLLIPVVVFTFWTGNLIIALLSSIILFGSIALHELGHSIVAQKKGSYIHEIVLYPFGGAAKISNIPKKPTDEILVALAGPAVSLLLAVIFQQIEPLLFIAKLNWMLFGFNVLPVFPMDGGRVFRAALSIKKGRIQATHIAAEVGKYFCILFVIIGLFGLKIPQWGIGQEPNFMLAFIGYYIYRMGRVEYQQVLIEDQEAHFSGFRENQIDIEVSPPPYAQQGSNTGSIFEKLRRWLKL